MLDRMRSTFREYPTRFWILVAATFIDRIGGTIIFPFFALYVTDRFDVGMTEAGILIAIFSVSGFIGNIIGGALSDRFGRKGMIIFGLVASALSSVAMGLVDSLAVFYVLAVAVGLLSEVGGPARQAMVADILPEEKRGEGFGVLRVAGNLAWVIGPSLGGLLASQSYLLLFVLDAISSMITAAIVFRLIPETMPEKHEDEPQESIVQTFAGYRTPLTDGFYVAFLCTSMLMLIVYQQMYNTLSVYLRDVHDVGPQAYGAMMSINAAVVVVFQFPFSRWIRPRPPMLMMVLGTLFYMVGFSMYGFVSTYTLFVVAIVIIVIGEMIIMPVSQALAARFAPLDMRGRYMAVFGLCWTIPSAVGPWAAGLVMDNFNPNWVWWAGGIISAVAAFGFYVLHLRGGERLAAISDPPMEAEAAI